MRALSPTIRTRRSCWWLTFLKPAREASWRRLYRHRQKIASGRHLKIRWNNYAVLNVIQPCWTFLTILRYQKLMQCILYCAGQQFAFSNHCRSNWAQHGTFGYWCCLKELRYFSVKIWWRRYFLALFRAYFYICTNASKDRFFFLFFK